MRLVLFGTGPFAVPAFEAILQSSHEVLALVTRPIADGGKRRKTAENPTRDLGQHQGLEIYDPPDVNAADFVDRLRELQADLFVVCDYGQILSNDCLGSSRKGGINLHGSLLPKYRGAAPIHWAIFHGETILGVTIIHMTARLDGGPCLASASIEVGETETTAEVEPRLAQLGIEPVMQALQRLETWDGLTDLGTQQDPRLATKAPRLKKSDGQLQWTRTGREIVNQIRAFQPWPGTYTFWPRQEASEPERLIVLRAAVVSKSDGSINLQSEKFSPGQVVFNDGQQLWVKCGRDVISLLEVQPSGKRAMSIVDFLRGHRLPIGTQLL